MKKLMTRSVRESKRYQCPACSKMVDNLDREAVRVHHDHVLHPRTDGFVKPPLMPIAESRARDRDFSNFQVEAAAHRGDGRASPFFPT